MSINSVGDENGTSIVKCICSGLILNTAALTIGGVYHTRQKDPVFIHPSSVFCGPSFAQKLKPSWYVKKTIAFLLEIWNV